MFQINSVILEGKVIGAPNGISNGDKRQSVIKIESNAKEGTFQIRAQGYGNVADLMQRWLKDGSQVRVVGKLNANDFGVFIIIEHLEIKPDKKSE